MHVESSRIPTTERALAHDDELVQRIVTRLQSRLGSPVHDFQIAARVDGLILQGRVKTHYGKQVAQEVAKEVSGLSILSNNIEVHLCDIERNGCQ